RPLDRHPGMLEAAVGAVVGALAGRFLGVQQHAHLDLAPVRVDHRIDEARVVERELDCPERAPRRGDETEHRLGAVVRLADEAVPGVVRVLLLLAHCPSTSAATSAIASPSTRTMTSICSRVTISGGQTTIRSAPGRRMTPRRRAAWRTRHAALASGGNGSRASLSRTSSTAPMSPAVRTSPTIGRAARGFLRPPKYRALRPVPPIRPPPSGDPS